MSDGYDADGVIGRATTPADASAVPAEWARLRRPIVGEADAVMDPAEARELVDEFRRVRERHRGQFVAPAVELPADPVRVASAYLSLAGAAILELRRHQLEDLVDLQSFVDDPPADLAPPRGSSEPGVTSLADPLIEAIRWRQAGVIAWAMGHDSDVAAHNAIRGRWTAIGDAGPAIDLVNRYRDEQTLGLGATALWLVAAPAGYLIAILLGLARPTIVALVLLAVGWLLSPFLGTVAGIARVAGPAIGLDAGPPGDLRPARTGRRLRADRGRAVRGRGHRRDGRVEPGLAVAFARPGLSPWAGASTSGPSCHCRACGSRHGPATSRSVPVPVAIDGPAGRALVDLRRAGVADRRRGQARPLHPAEQPERAGAPRPAARDGAPEVAIVRDDEERVGRRRPVAGQGAAPDCHLLDERDQDRVGGVPPAVPDAHAVGDAFAAQAGSAGPSKTSSIAASAGMTARSRPISALGGRRGPGPWRAFAGPAVRFARAWRRFEPSTSTRVTSVSGSRSGARRVIRGC